MRDIMESCTNRRARIEMSGIFSVHGNHYRERYNPCPHQEKVMSDICQCRTAQLGGHINACPGCGYESQSYNSCRNRHCPKCQFIKQEQWADKVAGRLFPGKYFHIVFTIPERLNPIFYINQFRCYALLFSAAWEALKKTALNPIFLGGETGAIAILHTWSQTLQYHPHIHMVVPAGGMSEDGMEWISSRKNFFVPVRVLSAIFRGILTRGLEILIRDRKLKCPYDQPLWGDFKSLLYKKRWNVHAKRAFGGPLGVVKYLARYSHRVAISNDRLISADNDKVTFRYKDNSDKGRAKMMTLEAVEFIRRFMMHVLPKGFYKIRYFGLFASVNLSTKTEQCIHLLAKEMYLSTLEGLNSLEAFRIITGRDPLRCPKCRTIMQKRPFAWPSG